MFDPVDPKQSLPKMEKGILQYWKEEEIFKRSVHHRKESGNFSFYDGPPFATGLPHYGHLLAGTIKDVIPRYQTMRGKRVERRFGWDCHGLPVENLIEKEHRIKSHKEIEKMGIKKFNDLCCSSVQRFTKEWRNIVERMGRWVDMDWDYRTMDPEYMESIWWGFKKLQEKGLVYEGHKSMHICPRCATPLSNFEVTQGYKDVTDLGVTVKFLLKEARESDVRARCIVPVWGARHCSPKSFLLAWTTTAWTLPGNLFLAVDPKMTYVRIRTEKDEIVIVSKDVYEKSKEGQFGKELPGKIKGKDLIGLKYEPLFPYFAEKYKDAFEVRGTDFVTSDEGTGIVHIAPGFGEDDYNLLKDINSRIPNPGSPIPLLQHVTMDGRFTSEVTEFAGLEVKPASDPSKTDRLIAEWLEKNGKLFAKEQYSHSYPHCWRCDSPLLNYSTSSWFVAVENIKEDLLSANSKTNWVPEHVRDGRFGKWLEGARDWAVSRNRFWGTPIPIWKCAETGEIEIIGSRDELMRHAPIRFTKVTVIRHGESEGNLIPKYQGKLQGTDLTDNGRKQVSELAKNLKGEKITTIYCSPFARTKQTAGILADETGARIIEDERIREVDFGEYEGKKIDFSDLSFVKARRAHKLKTGNPETIYHFPGMETWDQTQQRVNDFLTDILPRHRSEHILIVTHADPVRNIQHFFSREDPLKLSHHPYPPLAGANTYFYDHQENAQMDLHKHCIDDIEWPGGKSENSVEVTLVRHGQTDANKKKLIQGGEFDWPLNEEGRKQAHETAALLKGRKFDAIISSDKKRAVETAEIIAKELGFKSVEKLSLLNERSSGEWANQKKETAFKKHPPIREGANVSSHYATAPGGESLSKFLKRGQKTCEHILAKFAGRKILVVAHRGVAQSITAFVNNLSYLEMVESRLKNAESAIFTINPVFKRIGEVFDCWFESGSMPYAQPHFPFEPAGNYKLQTTNYQLSTCLRYATARQAINNQRATSNEQQATSNEQRATIDVPPGFPADFIAEGMDQTRGWFYTLMVLSTALFNEPAFINCVVNGIVLAEDGKKMSKKLKNYPEPMELVEKYGADAVRFTLMKSPAVRGEDLRFSEKMVAEAMRNVILKLWNSYSFFVTYANAAKFEPAETRRSSNHPLDIWIKAEIQDLVNRMTEQLDRYELSFACGELDETIDALTNWYIRLSRKRFAGRPSQTRRGGTGEDEDQMYALATLYDVLLTISQLIAPFCPYLADAIYLNLIPENHGSVHLTDWPSSRKLNKEEKELIELTRTMRMIVSLGHRVRSEKNKKNRQPLSKAVIALPPSLTKLSEENLELLRHELNVMKLEFADDPKKLASVIVKVNARKVGPRLGKKVQEIIRAGKNGDFTVKDDGSIRILDEELAPEEAEIIYQGKKGLNAAADRGIVVCVDTNVSDELKTEGDARDLIRTIQRLRKESGLKFTDRIHLKVEGADEIIKSHGKLISDETRSAFKNNDGNANEVELDGKKIKISFAKTSG